MSGEQRKTREQEQAEKLRDFEQAMHQLSLEYRLTLHKCTTQQDLLEKTIQDYQSLNEKLNAVLRERDQLKRNVRELLLQNETLMVKLNLVPQWVRNLLGLDAVDALDNLDNQG